MLVIRYQSQVRMLALALHYYPLWPVSMVVTLMMMTKVHPMDARIDVRARRWCDHRMLWIDPSVTLRLVIVSIHQHR